MSIVLHRKYTFVKNVTINIIKIKYHLNIKEKLLLKMIQSWILVIVIVTKLIKINYFVKLVMYQCV